MIEIRHRYNDTDDVLFTAVDAVTIKDAVESAVREKANLSRKLKMEMVQVPQEYFTAK